MTERRPSTQQMRVHTDQGPQTLEWFTVDAVTRWVKLAGVLLASLSGLVGAAVAGAAWWVDYRVASHVDVHERAHEAVEDELRMVHDTLRSGIAGVGADVQFLACKTAYDERIISGPDEVIDEILARPECRPWRRR